MRVSQPEKINNVPLTPSFKKVLSIVRSTLILKNLGFVVLFVPKFLSTIRYFEQRLQLRATWTSVVLFMNLVNQFYSFP